MSHLAQLDLRSVEKPELVIGLVGAVGTPTEKVRDLLTTSLTRVGYMAEELRLSRFLSAYGSLETPEPDPDGPAAERWNRLMSRGNELRIRLGRGDALAMHAAAEIASRRPPVGEGSRALEGKAFILRQLKHPDEVRLLRQVYGDAFHLVGIYTPESTRSQYLRNEKSLSKPDAHALLQRDAGEELTFGQQVTKTYHLSDLFIAVPGWQDDDVALAQKQVDRYIDLLFGIGIVTPTVDEYGMFLANAAALRSADLSRQVGAAILTQHGEILALGANEVPQAGGGQYWGNDYDDRDFVRGHDSNDVIKLQCVEEILRHLQPDWTGLGTNEQGVRVLRAARELAQTRLMNLTEFGRAVHAEMEALLSAARVGSSVRDHTLYTTTFPCHNCAKHIVGAGIARVVYVEPYPKSLADRLHGDAIAFSLDAPAEAGPRRVPFESFVGVAPRRYPVLFSMRGQDGKRVRRKTDEGKLRTEPMGLRIFSTPLSHVDREAMVASYLDQVMERLTQLKLEL